MLTKRYMPGVKNVPPIMQKIVDGATPDKFTAAHLKGLGFTSSNDLAIIPVLKDLQFLGPDGSPLQRYNDYRDSSKSKKVLGEALYDAYGDLFQINEKLSESDRDAIEGKFKSTHGSTDKIAELQARTFLAFLKLADVGKAKAPKETPPPEKKDSEKPEDQKPERVAKNLGGLHYNIEIHLPPTKDIEVFNAIFKSLKEHLIA